MRGCFALYLNYPFGLRDRVLRRTSFPTKLSTYVQAARPLLMNVPADSSVTPLADDPGPEYAAHWADTSPETGADALVTLWERAGSGGSRHDDAEAVRLRYFDAGRNRAALASALDALAAGD